MQAAIADKLSKVIYAILFWYSHLDRCTIELAVDLAQERRHLTFDPTAERFVDAPDADALLGRTYREGHWAAFL